jgi:phage host-nuclease inhibitor protein Gam
MSTKITSISLSQEDFELIEQYNLSCSALIKEKLASFRDVDTHAALKIKELNAKIIRLQEIIQKYCDFLESKGLTGEYLGLKDVVQ